jgi:antitoxin Phd
MSEVWQLQEAKSKFSEVVEDALRDGPQVITRRGVKTAVLLSYTDYQQMFLKQQKLSDFFRQSPLVGVDLDLSRDQSPIRDDLDL